MVCSIAIDVGTVPVGRDVWRHGVMMDPVRGVKGGGGDDDVLAQSESKFYRPGFYEFLRPDRL